jgi:hypothetical protein
MTDHKFILNKYHPQSKKIKQDIYNKIEESLNKNKRVVCVIPSKSFDDKITEEI